MKNAVLFSLLFLLTSITVSAQKFEYPNLRVGFTPSAFANYYTAIQFSLDKSLAKRVNFALESGFIYGSVFDARGFRIRPGVDWLMDRGEKAGLSIGLHINYRWSTEYRTLIRFDPSGNFNRIFYNQKRDRNYLSPMISLKYIYKPSMKWVLEFGIGGGFAYYNIRDDLPRQIGDRFEEISEFSVLDESTDLFIATNIHFNISYILRE